MPATASEPSRGVADRTGALLLVGLGAGAFAGLFGVGGGTVVVPLLLAMGLAAHRATAASLLAIAIMAAVGAAVQAGGYGQVDPLAALAVGLPAVGGVVLGTAIQQRLEERTVAVAFAGLLLLVAVTMLLGLEPDADAARPGAWAYVLLALVGVLGGVNSGLLGVGGGAVFVPGLVFCLGIDHVAAEATSLLAIVPVSLVGAWRQHRYGNLDVRVGLVLGLGAVPGAVLGVVLVNVLPVRLVEVLFALLLLQVAWRLLRHRRTTPEPAPAAP